MSHLQPLAPKLPALLLFLAACSPTPLSVNSTGAPHTHAASPAQKAVPTASTAATSAPPPKRLSLPLADRLSAGGIHNCFIDDFGKARCWGNPLGNKARGVPLEISGLSRATQISSSYDTACARTVEGRVECAGENFEVDFRGLTNVTRVAAGSTFNCAIHDAGKVSCWGSIMPGSTDEYPPTKLALSGAQTVAVGHYEGCIIDNHKRVFCFGHSMPSLPRHEYPQGHYHSGEQQDGAWIVVSEAKLPGVTQQAPPPGSASQFARCYTKELAANPTLTGHVVLKVEWGKAGQKLAEVFRKPQALSIIEQSFSGELAERMKACLVAQGQSFASNPGITGARIHFAPALTKALKPRHILDDATSLAMFGYLGCAVTTDGRVACWQQSDAFGTKTAQPEVLGGAQMEFVEGIDNAVQVTLGLRHICVRHADDAVSCFGDESSGALGGSAERKDEFGVVRLKLRAKYLTAGAVHTCAALDPPAVWCWGYGGRGGIGRGATEHRGYDPAPVEGLALPQTW